MQPIATITRHEAIDHDELLVRNWRVSQLKRCGIPGPLAEAYANHIDRHQATAAQVPAARHQPVLVILDLGHRELDSMEVIRRLRDCTEAPIIVLSGHASSIGEVVAMDAGARKSPAGSRAVYRRTVGDGDTSPVRIADLIVDLAARRVTRRRRDSDTAGQAADIRLTPTEWRLLEALLQHPGELLSQQQLLAEVWGPGYARAKGNLRLYIAQLRRKLEPDPARPRWLLTEPGMGYRFQPGPPAE